MLVDGGRPAGVVAAACGAQQSAPRLALDEVVEGLGGASPALGTAVAHQAVLELHADVGVAFADLGAMLGAPAMADLEVLAVRNSRSCMGWRSGLYEKSFELNSILAWQATGGKKEDGAGT